jgi:hypothetical protein
MNAGLWKFATNLKGDNTAAKNIMYLRLIIKKNNM